MVTGDALTIGNLSALLRHATLARALRLPVREFLAVRELTGKQPFLSPAQTVDFAECADRLRASGFDITQLDYLLRHRVAAGSGVAPTTAEISLFLTRLRTELAKVQPGIDPAMTPQEIAAAESEADQARRNLVKHTVAEQLGISPAASDLLLTGVIDRPAVPGQPCIEDFVAPVYVGSVLAIVESGAVAGESVALPELFLLYRLIHKIAVFLKRLAIADDELLLVLEPPAALGLPDLSGLPLVETSSVDYAAFERLIDLVRARDLLPFGAPAFPDIIGHVTGPSPSKQAWLDAIEQRTRWGAALVDLVGDGATLTAGGALRASFPADFARGALLLHVRACLDAMKRLGLTTAQVTGAIRSDLSAAVSTQVKNAAKARHTDEEWLRIAKDLRDPLREKQREALVAWAIAHPSPAQHQVWKDANELYEYLLIDVEMAPCMMTSRIKQAISSVQLFVGRVLLNLEHPQVDKTQPALTLLPPQVEEWRSWRKLYRVWEANRKVFLYPENWIEPELRDGKSPFFQELETQLVQHELSTENVQEAMVAYLDKLDGVSRLELVALCHELEEDAGIDTLHVVGRTYSTPHKYYYRRRVLGEWTAWERMDVDLEGDHLALVVWERRLYLFWLLFSAKTLEPNVKMPQGNQSMPKPFQFWEVKLAWSEYKKSRWTARRMSKRALETGQAADAAKLDELRSEIFLYHMAQGEELFLALMDAPHYSYDTFGYFHFRDRYSEPYAVDKYLTVPGTMAVPGGTELVNLQFTAELSGLPMYRDDNTTYKSTTTQYFDGTDWVTVAETVYPTPPVLDKSDFGQFKLVVPGNFTRYPLAEEFFFQDDRNTFFVRPITVTEPYSVLFAPDEVSFGKIDDLWNWYYQEATPIPAIDPAGPITRPGRTRKLLSGEVVDKRELAVASPMSAPAALKQGTPLSYEMNDDVQYYKESPFSQGGIIRNKFRTVEKLVFETHYHRHARAFIKALQLDGVDGFLRRSLQMQPDTMDFESHYDPQSIVAEPYPDNTVDFRYGSGYSLYNWELFFHVPMLIAGRLSLDQRFEEAQRWYHYVFDPTNTEGTGKQRFWQLKPFHEQAGKQIQTLEELLEDVQALAQQVAKWHEEPFKPHVIARMRVVAYMKNVVMKYLDNIIAWADQLFGRDTIESINEATNLYVLAAKILGPRPQNVPARAVPVVQTYDGLDDDLDPLSNALVDIEAFLPPSAPVGGQSGSPLGKLAYFCVARNDKLLAYWDTVADRLFKIRHCMNIEGVVRQLPLFEPPIDPALLVKAAAAGMDLASLLDDISGPLPSYRFHVMLQRANELAADVRSLGQSLLAALEKRDAEALALLRSTHELRVLDAVRDVRKQQVEEARINAEAQKKAKDIISLKQSYYGSRPFMNSHEQQHLSSLQLGMVLQAVQGGLETVASALFAIPDFKVGVPTTIGATFGGSNIGNILRAVSAGIGVMAGINNVQGQMASTLGGYHRRRDDWKFQASSAKAELAQAERQIAAAEVRLAIAEIELRNQEIQIENAREADELMNSKFTQQALYDWMLGQIATAYFQSYQLAYDLAKQAERCYRHELGIPDTSWIQFGYWDSMRKGLLAGEKLQYDLRRMEASFHAQNRRELELTKNVSLAMLDPAKLLELRRTGTCTITLPEELFDLDYQGHYFRRIRNVGLTLPCVAGPYTTVSCSLRLLSNRIRINTTSNGNAQDPYADLGVNDSRFHSENTPQTAVATSTGQNDSGLFELSFRDERYLPFEGTGAISTWQIALTDDPALRQFDYETISDVILHVRYTARADAGTFRTWAQAHLKNVINMGLQDNPMPLSRFFSARHEHPSEWYRFLYPADPADDQVLVMRAGSDRFPYFTQDRTIIIDDIHVYARVTTQASYTVLITDADETSTVSFTLTAGNDYIAGPDPGNSLAGFSLGDLQIKMKQVQATNYKSLAEAEVDDLIIVLRYHLQ
ncbi:MAG TPA: neuraminidase-like domain-containing protein [Haliangium sp.]|nr:neuraminidase-like domain-containing protein [Haliangium sp.]